jgi:hypothetical protein
MDVYSCLITQLCDITPPGLDAAKYRMLIKTVPREKVNQPDEKQYTKTYTVDVSCSRTLHEPWKLSRHDLEKVLCERAYRYFEDSFSRGELSATTSITLSTGNTPKDCPDVAKIQCRQGHRFDIQVTRAIGFKPPKRGCR